MWLDRILRDTNAGDEREKGWSINNQGDRKARQKARCEQGKGEKQKTGELTGKAPVPYPVKTYANIVGIYIGFFKIFQGWSDIQKTGKNNIIGSPLKEPIWVIKEGTVRVKMSEDMEVEDGFKDFRNSRSQSNRMIVREVRLIISNKERSS